jgi:uncharacterized protein
VTGLLEGRNDVSLVANVRGAQVEKFAAVGITTVRGLAESALELVPRMARDTFERLQSQARLQLSSIPGKAPTYKLLPESLENRRRGFGLLPPPSPNDVAFDIEGYPMIEDGLEYLLGVTCQENGNSVFKDWWAHNRVQEKASFESFVDWVYGRWKQDPSMHIYHYAFYETTALKRLMSRYASREEQVDGLLRNHVFVDLYAVVKQALLIGEPAYSLKNVEHLYLSKRNGQVATATDSMVYYYRWLSSPEGADWQHSPTLHVIRNYNQADCDSTWQLIQWLHECQSAAGRSYVPANPPTELAKETSGRARLAREMLAQIPEDRSADQERWRVHELLANLLEFKRREDKALHWTRFERLAMTEQELIEDPDCLGDLERTAGPPVTVRKSFRYEYRFPEQESKFRAGSKCELVTDGKTRVTIESINYDRQLLTVTRAKNREPFPDLALCFGTAENPCGTTDEVRQWVPLKYG